MHFETVQLMLRLAALKDWYISRLDVKSAYLYGELNEEIYMEQPEGFKIPRQENKVLCLWCALYGLKQARLAWWQTLNESMRELGFKCLKSNARIFLFKRKGSWMVVAIIYIDDALFCGPNKAIDKVKAHFMQKWEYRDLGKLCEFLHMCIRQNGHKISIDQCAYLNTVLQHFGMANAKSTPTPLPAGYYPMPNTESLNTVLQSKFQQVIRSLLYLSLRTCSDIANTELFPWLWWSLQTWNNGLHRFWLEFQSNLAPFSNWLSL